MADNDDKPNKISWRTRVRNWFTKSFLALRVLIGNARRMARRKKIGYIIIELSASSLRDESRPIWDQLLPRWLRNRTRRARLYELRETLQLIAADPRPQGIIIDASALAVGPTTALALYNLLTEFKQSGKRVIVYSEDFYLTDYLAIAPADEIIMPPTGSWLVSGIRSEIIFWKDALAAWDVSLELVTVGPRKGGEIPFSHADMLPEVREQAEGLLDTQFTTILNLLAQARHLTPDALRTAIDDIPHTAQRACELGLITHVCYLDEIAHLLATDDKPAQLERLRKVRDDLKQPIRWPTDQQIAILNVTGPLLPGRGYNSRPLPLPLPISDDDGLGADTFAQAIREIESDPSISALIMVINSPGGSTLASDLMYREILRLRKHKPVVALLSDVAASGGYYLACAADYIIASPLTVTGSIGVYSQKLVLNNFIRRLRGNPVILRRGARAGMFTDNEPLTDDTRTALLRSIHDSYDRFKQIVAEGRKLDPASVDDLAGGRVYLAPRALKLGLIDELGDFQTAFDKAHQLANLPKDRFTPPIWWETNDSGEVKLPRPYPKDPTPDTPSVAPAPAATLAHLAHWLEHAGRVEILSRLPFDIKYD